MMTDKEVIDLYQSGIGLLELTRRNGCTIKKIRRILITNGIEIRKLYEYDNQNRKVEHMDYFENIDCPQKAYWLGYIAADAHINLEKKIFHFVLANKDVCVLEKFKSDIGYSPEVKIYTRDNKYNKCSLCFNSRQFTVSLTNVVKWKNGDPEPLIGSIPEQYISSFILGLFDGDGCIQVKKRSSNKNCLDGNITIVDNKENKRCLEVVAEILFRCCNITLKTVKERINCCSLVINGRNQIIRVYNWLYSNNTFCLERKRNKFKILNGDDDIYYSSNLKLIFNKCEDCFVFMLKHGFSPPKYDVNYSDLDLLFKCDDYFNNNYNNPKVTNLIKSFSPHFWYSTHKGYNYIAKAWEHGNNMVLKCCINDLWESKQVVNLDTIILSINRHFKDFCVVSIFKPWVARGVYDKLLNGSGRIFDPCMGWGGRLLGCVDSDYVYIGNDLNPNSCNSNVNIAKFANDRLKCAPIITNFDASTMVFPDADLLFTSPPYDDTELYCGLDKQCNDTFSIYDNIYRNFKGIIALNVPKRHVELCGEVAAKYGRKIDEVLEMKTNNFMGRESNFEPIVVSR